MQKPKVVTQISEMVQIRNQLKTSSIGFVPTMGALHSGHAQLLKEMKANTDIRILSIFVNPTQFGPKEDFGAYPRTLEADLEIAEREGVDFVFAPSIAEIYAKNHTTFVEENELTQSLCGKFRPGHFRGVTTIVAKLFNIIRPDIAFFGLKDAQQFYVIKKMVDDLNFNLQVKGVPTVREPDGLALSSRNRYLSAEEREIAPWIHRTLQEIQNRCRTEATLPISSILTEAARHLTGRGFQVQYLECLELPNLHPAKSSLQPGQTYLVAIAAYLGKTRLIDNLEFSLSTV